MPTRKCSIIMHGIEATAISPRRTIVMSRGTDMFAVGCVNVVLIVLVLEFHVEVRVSLPRDL